MRPGDGVRDFGQGWKDFARVFESVFGHDHGVRAAVPFPHQSSARLKGQIGCDDDTSLELQFLAQRRKPPLGSLAQSSVGISSCIGTR